MGNHTDDRPPRVIDRQWMTRACGQVSTLIEKYPDPVAPNTQASVEAAELAGLGDDDVSAEVAAALDSFGIDQDMLKAASETAKSVACTENIFTSYMAPNEAQEIKAAMEGHRGVLAETPEPSSLVTTVRETQRRIADFRRAVRGPSVVMDETGVVKEYDETGLCVRESVRILSKDDAIHECETRYGVSFEKD